MSCRLPFFVIIFECKRSIMQEKNNDNFTLKEQRVVNIIEGFIMKFEKNSLLGLSLPAGHKNIKAFICKIYGEQALYTIWNKYAKEVLARVKDSIRKQRMNILNSKKVQSLQNKYPNLNIKDAYIYACLTKKFALSNNDLKEFEGILNIALKNVTPLDRNSQEYKKQKSKPKR